MELTPEQVFKIITEDHPDWEVLDEKTVGVDHDECIEDRETVVYSKSLEKHLRISYARIGHPEAEYTQENILLHDEFEIEEVEPIMITTTVFAKVKKDEHE